MNDQKEIKIISGNGKDLEISSVSDHLNIDQPLSSSPDTSNIIIPEEKDSNN